MASKKTIAIEIGHRYPDPGAVYSCGIDGCRTEPTGDFRCSECKVSPRQEYKLNLTVGIEIKRQLERHGFDTSLNRTEWVGTPLVEFYDDVAKTNNLVAGVAVHFNGVGSSGFEVFTQTTTLTGGSMRADSRKQSQ